MGNHKDKTILLSHGGGGEETRELIEGIFKKHLSNPFLDSLEDATTLPPSGGSIAFTTDSFTVSPIFFKGGNIGKLAVAGTVNDLSVSGAMPLYLSSGFVIEEGFPMSRLDEIVKSMAIEAEKSGVMVVTGDTKVMPRGSINEIVINTSGIGKIVRSGLSATSIRPGDIIGVSGSVGDHGACILAEREGLNFDLALESDCESLWSTLKHLFDTDIKIHALRDPTRGGLSAVLNEWAASSSLEIEVWEDEIPIQDAVRGLCEMLGMDPLQLASEGRFVAALPPEGEETFLDIAGKDARIIGKVLDNNKPRVILKSSYGTKRIMEPPSGELLPRIC